MAGKLLSTVPDVIILACIEGEQNISSDLIPVTLVLTSDTLYVVAREDDTLLQAFALSEVDIHEHGHDEGQLLLAPTFQPTITHSAVQENTDRIAAFVGGTNVRESLPSTCRHFEFTVDPVHKQFFTLLFSFSKENMSMPTFM